MTCDASSLFSATALVTMALIMLIGDGSTMCHVVRHLAHTPTPIAPVAISGIPVVPKPPIVPVATLPLMLIVPTIPAVGVVPQIHVVSNTAVLPPMSAVVPTIMPKVMLSPMLVIMAKVGALPPMPVVVPKVGDLPSMPSIPVVSVSIRSHECDTNSVDRPVKMLVESVSQKLRCTYVHILEDVGESE
uniref:Uncharacterized protein n=1 Tax=Zea mays TaxID=4577 RepID=A0A804LD49_MAIZE